MQGSMYKKLRLLLYVLFIRHLDSVKNKSFLRFTQKNFSHFNNCLSYTLIHSSLVPLHSPTRDYLRKQGSHIRNVYQFELANAH